MYCGILFPWKTNYADSQMQNIIKYPIGPLTVWIMTLKYRDKEKGIIYYMGTYTVGSIAIISNKSATEGGGDVQQG